MTVPTIGDYNWLGDNTSIYVDDCLNRKVSTGDRTCDLSRCIDNCITTVNILKCFHRSYTF